MTDKTDAAEIVGKLTEAQRRSLVSARYHDEGFIHGLKTRGDGLTLAGLANIHRYLTHTGVAVRNHLLEKGPAHDR